MGALSCALRRRLRIGSTTQSRRSSTARTSPTLSTQTSSRGSTSSSARRRSAMRMTTGWRYCAVTGSRSCTPLRPASAYCGVLTVPATALLGHGRTLTAGLNRRRRRTSCSTPRTRSLSQQSRPKSRCSFTSTSRPKYRIAHAQLCANTPRRADRFPLFGTVGAVGAVVQVNAAVALVLCTSVLTEDRLALAVAVSASVRCAAEE